MDAEFKRSPCLYYSKLLEFRQVLFDIFVENQYCTPFLLINFVNTDELYTICKPNTQSNAFNYTRKQRFRL